MNGEKMKLANLILTSDRSMLAFLLIFSAIMSGTTIALLFRQAPLRQRTIYSLSSAAMTSTYILLLWIARVPA